MPITAPAPARARSRRPRRVVSRATGSVRGALFDLVDPGGLLHAADRAAQPDRVLRRPSAGVQRDRVPRSAASAMPASTSGSSGCSRAASIPTASTAPCRAAAPIRCWPSRERGARVRRARRRAIVDALERARRSISPGTTHPAMRRGEALFTALEHEAMHQETLLYMWHRLPHAQKRAPAALALRARRRRRVHATVGDPGGCRDARRRSATRSRSAGTTSSTRTRRRAGVRDRRAQRHQRRLPRVRRGRRLRTRASCGRLRAGHWRRARRRSSIPRSGCATASGWYWRGMFENIPLPRRGRCT